MMNLYKMVLDPAFRKPYGNVNRWFTTVINQPNVKAVVGDFALCTKMAEFDAKKFAEFSGKGKKEEKPKKEKKAAEKPAEKKAEKKPEPAEDAPAPLLRRKMTPWTFYPPAPSTWMSSRGPFPTMTMMWPSSGSGRTSTPSTTPSGGAITSTTMNSPWSSCLVIS